MLRCLVQYPVPWSVQSRVSWSVQGPASRISARSPGRGRWVRRGPLWSANRWSAQA